MVVYSDAVKLSCDYVLKCIILCVFECTCECLHMCVCVSGPAINPCCVQSFLVEELIITVIVHKST